eukprot:403342964
MQNNNQVNLVTDIEVQKLVEQKEIKSKLDALVNDLVLNEDNFEALLKPTTQLKMILYHLVEMHILRKSAVDIETFAQFISSIKDSIKSKTTLKEDLCKQLTNSVESDLIDITCMKFNQIQTLTNKSVQETQKKSLALLIQYLRQHQLLGDQQIFTYMDEQTLCGLGIIETPTYNAKHKRVNTQYFYEQQKFNLLREENEGFAKLIVELNQPSINESNIQVLKRNIEALIGYFNLDPNRVLDIILDSFENNIWNSSYITLIKDPQFKNVQVSSLLGFKYQTYQEQINSDKNFRPPQSLFTLTALLIKNQVIQFEDIWPYMNVTGAVTDDSQIDEVENLLSRQIKLAQIQYEKISRSSISREQNPLEIQELEDVNRLRAQMHQNFRIRLLESFVKLNEWQEVDEIIGTIYDNKLDLTLSKDLLNSMMEQLEWFIEPLYAPLSKSKIFKPNQQRQLQLQNGDGKQGNIRQARNGNIFFEEIFKILKPLNIYISQNQIIMHKFCTVLRQIYNLDRKKSFLIIGEVLIPALTLVENNNEISEIIWDIFQHADYTVRYENYIQMMNHTYLQNFHLILKTVQIQDSIKQWLKRLSIDTVKQNSRQLAKLASGNALIVANSMLMQAKSYSNMIESQIQSYSFCGSLQLDMVAFSLIRILSDSTEDRLDKDANPQEWITNLSEYAALFFKKYCHVDMQSLLTYLLNKLRDNEYNEAMILKEVISKMLGWSQFNLNEMTAAQLQSLAGGMVLKLELMSQYANFKRTSKSSDALQNLFWNQTNDKPLSLAFRLKANLAKMTQYIMNNVKTDQLILISTLFDRMQFTFIQFVESLGYLENIPSRYSSIFPPQPEKILTLNYRLPPQYVFQILRGGLKKIQQLTDDEFNQKVHEFKSVLDMNLNLRQEQITDEIDEKNEFWDERTFIKARSEEIWKCLNPKLYMIFWYLQLQSLLVPNDAYADQIKKLQTNIDKLKNEGGSSQKKNAKEIEKEKQTVMRLIQEQKDYQQNQQEIDEFLAKRLPECFQNIDQGSQYDWSTLFIQYCLYPRIMFSATDSLYTFNFFKMLHKHRVPYFNILNTLGQILKGIVPAIHCCTEKESENLGVFFLELFQLIDYWSKVDVWDKQCKEYSGFAKMIGKPDTIKLSEFQQIAESIHKRFAQNLIVCFQNAKQQMKTKCGLTILNKMRPMFPNQYLIAKVIQKHLQGLIDKKTSIDQMLYTLALSCNQNLIKKMETMDKPQSVIDQELKAAKELVEKEREREKEKEERKRDRGDRDQRDKDRVVSSREPESTSSNNLAGGSESRRKVKEREKEASNFSSVDNNNQGDQCSEDKPRRILSPNTGTSARSRDNQPSNRETQSVRKSSRQVEQNDQPSRGGASSRNMDQSNSREEGAVSGGTSASLKVQRRSSRSPIISNDNKRRNTDRSPPKEDDRRFREVKRPREEDIKNRIIPNKSNANNQRK